MWTKAARALAALVRGWKRWTLAHGWRPAQVRNLFAFLILVVAYAVRARAERLRWDERLRRQADGGGG
jgi:hypothetical protein